MYVCDCIVSSKFRIIHVCYVFVHVAYLCMCLCSYCGLLYGKFRAGISDSGSASNFFTPGIYIGGVNQ